MTGGVNGPRTASGADASAKHLRHEEFRIGGSFWCSGKRWRCTDIGTRVITAIKLNHEDDPSWYAGPPYAVEEVVFDEYDIESCTLENDSDKTVSSTPDAGRQTSP